MKPCRQRDKQKGGNGEDKKNQGGLKNQEGKQGTTERRKIRAYGKGEKGKEQKKGRPRSLKRKNEDPG